jgi:transposase
MSRMSNTTKSRRPRRQFDDDFKAQAVRPVLDEGKTVGAVARDLDLTETALREWVTRARANRTNGRTGLTTAEREELARLRKENRILREEREILKRRRPSSRTSGGEISIHRGGEGAPRAQLVVSVSPRDAEWVLCMAAAPGVGSHATGPPAEGAGAGLL